MLSLSQAFYVFVALLVLRYLYRQWTVGRARRAFCAAHACQPLARYPARNWLLGLDTVREIHQAEKSHRLLELTEASFARAGRDTFTYQIAGRRMIMTREPENVKAILATKFDDWCLGRTRETIKALLGEGIFTNDGKAWQHSRELLRPNFVRSQVADLELFEAHVQRLIAFLPRDGSMCDLMEPFHRLTMDVATEFLFGESTLILNSEDNASKGQQFADAFDAIATQDKNSEGRLVGKIYRLYFPSQEFKKNVELVKSYAGELVEKALSKRVALAPEKEGSGRYVFLDHLVQQITDPIRIRSELLNTLLAGRDTTAALLTNVWFVLARRPDVYSRLAQEIASHVGDASPTYAQIKSMKYLGATLNEALRIWPIVPGNSRESAINTVLPRGGGPDGLSPVFVAKGEHCMYSVWSMHRRTDLFGEDAADFRPERWLDGEVEGDKGIRPGWDYLPFNGGPRICIGQQFALMEASYVTIRLMQEFAGIESRDSQPWRESMGITCRSLNGCRVSLKPKA